MIYWSLVQIQVMKNRKAQCLWKFGSNQSNSAAKIKFTVLQKQEVILYWQFRQTKPLNTRKGKEDSSLSLKSIRPLSNQTSKQKSKFNVFLILTEGDKNINTWRSTLESSKVSNPWWMVTKNYLFSGWLY